MLHFRPQLPNGGIASTTVAEFSEESDVESINDPSADSMRKDVTEEELEKLVFGDDAGFRSALRSSKKSNERALALTTRASDDEDRDLQEKGSEEDEGRLGGIADADLFFLDSGPGQSDGKVVIGDEKYGSENGESDRRPQAAWEDSDDERVTVSLANNSRLRKLRVAEAEDIVNGKEYTKRLRRQYERLYPTPEWAMIAPSQPKMRRRRRSNASQSSASDDPGNNATDTDSEEETTTTTPLAKILQNIGDLSREEEYMPTKRLKLRAEVVDIQRSKDVGATQPSSIDSLTFHPHHPVLLSSGPSSTLFLHHISPSAPNPNPLLTSLHIRHTPIQTIAISPSGTQIYLSGRRRYLHIWNLNTGIITKLHTPVTHSNEQRTLERFKLSPDGDHIALIGSSQKGGGVINILNAHTCQWVAQARVDSRGGVADMAWWSNGTGITIAAKNGEMSEYDLNARRIAARWTDDGAVGTTVIAMSGSSSNSKYRSSSHPGRGGGGDQDHNLGGDRFIATGSTSGIVNIYDRHSWNVTTPTDHILPFRPKPLRTLDQLVTPISNLVFSPPPPPGNSSIGNNNTSGGQILAMSSRWKRDALRLVHLPTGTVYRNWPTGNTPLGRVTSVAFSSSDPRYGDNNKNNSGGHGHSHIMLAVGNEQGKVRLWEIRG